MRHNGVEGLVRFEDLINLNLSGSDAYFERYRPRETATLLEGEREVTRVSYHGPGDIRRVQEPMTVRELKRVAALVKARLAVGWVVPAAAPPRDAPHPL